MEETFSASSSVGTFAIIQVLNPVNFGETAYCLTLLGKQIAFSEAEKLDWLKSNSLPLDHLVLGRLR